MKLPRLRTILLVPVVLFALLYVTLAFVVLTDSDVIETFDGAPGPSRTIAIFGASGTAGDGILKAAMADPGVHKIHVITRRDTPRINDGVASGKVRMTTHMDYLDYSAVHEQIAESTDVYWAIGTSSIGVDEETYGKIHVDFPVRFVEEWLRVSDQSDLSFHYISSSDISEDSTAMWAREKIRAEQTLSKLTDGSKIRTVFYRPDYIRPAGERAHLGQRMLYWFFAPVGAAVRSPQIGQAMLEVTSRGAQFDHGAKISTRNIKRYSDAYERRNQQ